MQNFKLRQNNSVDRIQRAAKNFIFDTEIHQNFAVKGKKVIEIDF